VDVLKLRPEHKKVTANMTSMQFGRDLPLALARVVPISKRELKVINADPHLREEKGLVHVPTPLGEIMWVHPDIIQSRQWTTVIIKKSKGKASASYCNVVSLSLRETEEGITSLTDSEEEESAFATDPGIPPMSSARSDK